MSLAAATTDEGPLDHVTVYGAIPPAGAAVAIPIQFPSQSTGLSVITALNNGGSVNVTVEVT